MCLLIVAWYPGEPWPLIVGANRDEWLDRPTTAITVLQAEGPRIVGGRDERAGGTWLAVNQFGVVCGLTNRPMPDGPDPGKHSRGRLPLLAAAQRTAVTATDALVEELGTHGYNPAWLLVGDRHSLSALAVDGKRATEPVDLEPGIHVLENAPLGQPSVKVDHVRAILEAATAGGVPLWEALPAVLGDHSVPDASAGGRHFADGRERREATLAACVHADGYGTRSSAVIRIPAGEADLPEMLVADGPPCTTPFVDTRELWSDPR